MRQIELLKLGENVLKKENIQDSHIKASTLLQYVLKQTKQELIINSKEIVEPSKINKYNSIYSGLEGKKGIIYLDSGDYVEVKE